MLASYATIEQLEKALLATNRKFGGNLAFNNLKQEGKRVRFTLRANSSADAGHRRGLPGGRRMVSACWHAHGSFFEELFKINPSAKVFSSRTGWITATYGNWQDFNIGSQMSPVYMSEACDCAEAGA